MPDKTKPRSPASEPTRFAQTPPPAMPSGDYSFLEMVMSMQSTMGELKEAVNGLKESRTDQSKKLEAINEKLGSINRKVYTALAFIALAGALLGIFGKPIVEAIFNRLSPAAQTAPATQPSVPEQSVPAKTR